MLAKPSKQSFPNSPKASIIVTICMIAIKLTLSVLTAMVTLYLFQIASYTSPYWPPPSLCFITMSVLKIKAHVFSFHHHDHHHHQQLIQKNIHCVKKGGIVSSCTITAITRCELRLAAKLRNQTIIAEARRAKSRREKRSSTSIEAVLQNKTHRWLVMLLMIVMLTETVELRLNLRRKAKVTAGR